MGREMGLGAASGSESEKRLATGAVVGIVVGSVALASALVALATFFLLRRRSKRSQSKFGGKENLNACTTRR